MNRRQRQSILIVLVAIAAVAMLFRLYRQGARPPLRAPVGVACGEPCGEERWSIMTLSDPDVGQVNFSPQPTTVEWLIAQPVPSSLPFAERVPPVETQEFTVQARLVGFKGQRDRDIHIVIAGLNDPGATMVAEIPSPDCEGVCASAHRDEIAAARAEFVSRFGNPAIHYREVPGAPIVTITGVGFFDYRHGQTGLAPNGVEIHPILRIAFE